MILQLRLVGGSWYDRPSASSCVSAVTRELLAVYTLKPRVLGPPWPGLSYTIERRMIKHWPYQIHPTHVILVCNNTTEKTRISTGPIHTKTTLSTSKEFLLLQL